MMKSEPGEVFHDFTRKHESSPKLFTSGVRASKRRQVRKLKVVVVVVVVVVVILY